LLLFLLLYLMIKNEEFSVKMNRISAWSLRPFFHS
jgi:hypothetical protein